jgi:DNA-binding transcriptional regulator/RsmH inhibitor MraZ
LSDDSDARSHWGEYERAVDEKGRIILPPVVRAALGHSFTVECHEGPCIRLTPADPDSSIATSLDPQGRVRLRAFYLRWAGLDQRDRVVVAVLGDSLEFWRKETWTWFIKKTGQFEFDLDPEVLRRGKRKD